MSRHALTFWALPGLRDYDNLSTVCCNDAGAEPEGGGDPPAEPPADPPEPKDLKGMKARLKELTDQRADFKAKWEAATATGETTASEHAAALEAVQAQLDEANGLTSRHGMERTLWKAQVEYDDDTLDFLALKYSKVEAGEDGEKPAFGDWFEGFSKTSSLYKKSAPAPASDPPADPEKPNGSPPPKADPAPGTKPPPAPAELTTEQIQALTVDQYKAWRSGKRIVVR